MAVVLLAAFLIIACLLALRFEKQLTAVLPLATCILILILYVLAFFRRLSWIDYFSTAIVVGAVLRVLFLSGEKKKKLFAQLRELFFAPSAIAAMVLLTGAVLLTGNKMINEKIDRMLLCLDDFLECFIFFCQTGDFSFAIHIHLPFYTIQIDTSYMFYVKKYSLKCQDNKDVCGETLLLY